MMNSLIVLLNLLNYGTLKRFRPGTIIKSADLLRQPLPV